MGLAIEGYDFSDTCWRVRYSNGDWEGLNRQEVKQGKEMGPADNHEVERKVKNCERRGIGDLSLNRLLRRQVWLGRVRYAPLTGAAFFQVMEGRTRRGRVLRRPAWEHSVARGRILLSSGGPY